MRARHSSSARHLVQQSLRALSLILFVALAAGQAGSPRESLSAKAARLAAGQLKLAEGEVLSPSSPTDNVIFATYLDHLGELACSSVRSAVATGVELAVLALNDGGAGYLHERDPKRRKVSALRAFLRHFSNDTLLVFSDGTDVLYTPSARGRWTRLLRDFLLHKPDSALFGAERNCWPMMDGERELQPGGREKCGRLTPARGSYSSFQYINAGNWIARREVADALLADWQRVMERPDMVDQDDQSALQRLMWDRDSLPYKIEVDDSCLLFQTGWGTKLERGGWRDPPGEHDRSGPYLRLRTAPGGYCEVVNTETQTQPALAHFNGGKGEFVPAERFCFENMGEGDVRAFLRRLGWYVGLYPQIAEKCSYAKQVLDQPGG